MINTINEQDNGNERVKNSKLVALLLAWNKPVLFFFSQKIIIQYLFYLFIYLFIYLFVSGN